MNVQPIKPYTTNSTSFKAKPVGLAKNLLVEALTNVKMKDDAGSYKKACKNLTEMSEIARHFNGENKPLEITARPSCGTFCFYYTDKNGHFIPYADILKESLVDNPAKFISDTVSSLKKMWSAREPEIKYLNEEIESKLFFEKTFGK